MRAAFPLFLGLISVGACAAQAPANVQYRVLPDTVAVYNNGYLLSWDSPQFTRVALYDRNGKLAYNLPDQKVNSSHIMWAADSDGTVAAAYVYGRPSEGRIDVLDPFGNVTRTINTSSYVPLQVTFAPDHTLWTVGYNDKTFGKEDFNVLHHYARSGEELGEALLWSQLSDQAQYPIIHGIRGGRLLYVANDRIGWNASLHFNSPRTWVEMSFSGTVMGKYDLRMNDNLSLWPVAMTSDGSVYAQMVSRDPHSKGYATLDRSKGIWRKLIGNPAGLLIGSDGDNLAFFKSDPSLATIQLVDSGKLQSEAIQQTPKPR